MHKLLSLPSKYNEFSLRIKGKSSPDWPLKLTVERCACYLLYPAIHVSVPRQSNE